MFINSVLLRVLPQKPFIYSFRYLRSNHQQCLPNVFISTQYATDVTVTAVPKPKVVNKAMNAYLIRAKEHDQFMKVQDEEYHIGKRHLANMMGEDPETFTQEDVDNAIAYLFPSGLFDSRARPFMKPPEEVYPQRKAAEFDETGRPFHSMFYTGKANFYKLLYDIVEHINEVNSFEDRMLRKQTTVDPALQLTLFGMQWITKDELENELVESLADLEYQHFVIAMERLVSLPYSYRIKDFILKYRKPLLEQSTTYEIAKPKYDTDGRMYVTTYECLRKKARGNVTVRSPGSGKISINGQDITYFEHMQPREQAATPKLMVQWRTVPDGMIEQQYPSDGFEYMECGPSPPAENVPINMYDKFEESVADLNIQVCKESIRNSLIDQMKASGGRSKLLDDIEHGQILSSNVVSRFENSIKLEKNISFLWSCFLKRWDLLDGLISVGAESGFYDSNGISGLHLAAYSGCLTCTSFLISKAIDVNLQPKFHTPLHFAAFGNSTETAKMLISNGASINMCTAKQNCDESLLHCAVRANAVECIKLFIQEGADVNSLKPNGTNPIHLAADLGLAQSLKVLLESPRADPNIRICIREKESTALHLASDEGNAECVNLLLAKGADAALKNHRGFTPLHLAARTSSLECVESLLRNGSANPNAEDFDHRTPLHAAVGKSDYSFDILETLIAWGANINHKDVFGFTALHLAALDGLAPCVEMLIFHGADVTTKSRKGTSALNVITRKTPQSLAMVHHKLDSAISLHQSQETATREVELELDFRQLMQHCHPREISFLHTFIKEGQKEFLEHPLCSAFLYIKWGKIRKFFIARLLFCFITVLFLSLYVLTALAHSCYNGSKDMNETLRDQELCQKQSILGDMLRKNPFVIEMQWWVLVVIIIAEIVRKLYGLTGYSSVKHYVTQIENIIEWFVIISVFLTSYIYNKRTDTWQNHIAAFAVLLGWTNLMLMIGQLPVFGVYVSMYTKVQVEFGKLFMAYSCMLIGFTISFCVIFPDSPVFSNPFMGFITVLVLMIGEQDLTLLTNEPDGQDPPVLLEISAQITFVLFLLFVTVILMNLLVGIAVNDIQALKKTAELSKLVRQTELILYIESALFKKYLPVWLKKILHNTALVSPQAYRAVLCLKPLNPGEKRLPKDILMRAYEVAKERNVQDTSTSTYDSPDSFGQLDKFKIDNNNVKTPLPPAPDSDYVFDTVSLCALTTKIDENAEKIDSLTNDIRELKSVLHQNDHVIDQLLLFLANQQKK